MWRLLHCALIALPTGMCSAICCVPPLWRDTAGSAMAFSVTEWDSVSSVKKDKKSMEEEGIFFDPGLVVFVG